MHKETPAEADNASIAQQTTFNYNIGYVYTVHHPLTQTEVPCVLYCCIDTAKGTLSVIELEGHDNSLTPRLACTEHH